MLTSCQFTKYRGAFSVQIRHDFQRSHAAKSDVTNSAVPQPLTSDWRMISEHLDQRPLFEVMPLDQFKNIIAILVRQKG